MHFIILKIKKMLLLGIESMTITTFPLVEQYLMDKVTNLHDAL